MQIGCLSRGLFSYKSPLFCNPKLGLQNSPAKALDDKDVSSSAELDQQALPAGHPLPFEKEAKLRLHKLGAARQRVGFRTKPIRGSGAASCRPRLSLDPIHVSVLWEPNPLPRGTRLSLDPIHVLVWRGPSPLPRGTQFPRKRAQPEPSGGLNPQTIHVLV